MNIITLPKPFFKYFWDVEPRKINLQSKKAYIIERFLEYGDEHALHWLRDTFREEEIKDIVKHSRVLSIKSATFYSLYFGIDHKDILCLQEDFRNQHRKIWNY